MLLLHRTLGTDGIIAAMEAAVTMGRFDPDLVAVEARRLGQPSAAPALVLPATAGGVGAPTTLVPGGLRRAGQHRVEA